MTLSYPLDFLSAFPGWATEFDLQYRQERSATAGGKTYVKDFGEPLWKATYQSRAMRANELDAWRARLKALENGMQTFIAWPMSRAFPIAYPRGSWPTGNAFSGHAQLNSVGPAEVSLKGLPVGYVVSIGDYIQIGDTDLYQVLKAGVANATGVTASLDVRPHLWPGTAVDAVVKLAKPSCIMSIVPDTVTSTADAATGRGSVTFQAIESRE